nr:alpha/beta hydrolase [uncultured Pedobacter sp.]
MKKAILIFTFILVSAISTHANRLNEPFTVQVSGKGQAMIFIPGATCSGEEWESTVAHYNKKYECHVFTLAGYAGVPPLNGGPYLSTFKSALINYIRVHKLKNVILVGHSIGGFLALNIAAEMKDALSMVIVIDAMPFYAAAMNPNAQSGFNETQAKTLLAQYNKMNDAQLKAYQLNVAKSLCADSTRWDAIATWGANSDRKTMAYTFTEMMREDIQDKIASIHVPVLVLAAFKESPQFIGFTREYVSRTFQKQYAKCKTCTIKVSNNARHFIMFDEPNWMLAEMDTFITKL